MSLTRRLTIVALAVFLETAGGSCVQIDGGAVEVSWVVHANGRAITDCTCSDPEIASVRIDIVGHGGNIEGSMPCAGQPKCVFSCARQTGATPFNIPETRADETYLIQLVAVDKYGADLPIRAPLAPISRAVVRGTPTELEAVTLDAGCALACETMNKTGVCAHP
jgi:hypothetical protein